MDSNPFKEKIARQHEIVLKELNKFRTHWEGKILESDKIEPYCNLINYVSQLHSTYVYNCMEYFTPTMKQQTIRINQNLVSDLVNKLKQLQSPYNYHSNSSPLEKPESRLICQVCSTKIRQVDIKVIKEQLADDAYLRKSLLRKMYMGMENDNAELFTKDQDEVFFKFLNRILIKKQEVLAMQTKEINDFLVEVTKSFSDLNFLTQYTPVKLTSGEYKENYKEDMEKTIVESLKTGFNGKVHPWVTKVFLSMRKLIMNEKRQNYIEYTTQTSDQTIDYNKKRSQYAASTQNKRQLESLKTQIQLKTIEVQQLKSKISVLQKQKRELEEYYAKEISELMMGKRKVQMDLKKTETDLFNLKETKTQEISELNRKIVKDKKKKSESNKTQEGRMSFGGDDDGNDVQNNSKTLPNQENGFNNEKQPELSTMTQLKKKKSHLKRLLSKKSQALTSGVDLSMNESKIRNPTIDPTEQPSSKIAEQFLKEIKLSTKKKSFKIDKQQTQSRVDFKLNDNDDSSRSQENKPISIIDQESGYDGRTEDDNDDDMPERSVPQIVRKKSSQKSSKKGKKSGQKSRKNNNQDNGKSTTRSPKRMLSIQMKIPPLTKASSSIYKPTDPSPFPKSPSSSLSRRNPTQQPATPTLSPTPSTKPLPSTKKVFSFVPLQNKQQQQQLKEKVNELTSKIELRNTQKLKSSMKVIAGEGELGKLYGFSIFNKKLNSSLGMNGHSQAGKGDSSQAGNYSKGDGGNADKRSDELNENSSNKHSKSNSHTKNTHQSQQLNPHIANPNIINTTIQPILTSSISTQTTPTPSHHLYTQLSHQSILPQDMSFEHYEMIVRRLFGQLDAGRLGKEEEVSVFSMGSGSNGKVLGNNNNRHKEAVVVPAVKINIDARFFESGANNSNSNSNSYANSNGKRQSTTKYQQAFSSTKPLPLLTPTSPNKLLLNLPKLHNLPTTNRTSSTMLMDSINSLGNNSPTTLVKSSNNQQNNKSLFHTFRERKNCVGEGNGRSNDHSLMDLKLAEDGDNKSEENVGSYYLNVNNKENQPILPGVTNKTNQPQHPLKKPHHLNPSQSIFTPGDLRIFFQSQLSAYQYQQTHHKTSLHSFSSQSHLFSSQQHLSSSPNPKPPHFHLSPSQTQKLSSLFTILTQLKHHNLQTYHKVCSFIKYPYQTVTNGFSFINIGKELRFEEWVRAIVRIYRASDKGLGEGYSRGDKADKRLGFEEFIAPLEDKLVGLLVMGSN